MNPIIFNDGADVGRLNALLDQLLEKPFLSPTVAINAIRAALNLHGISLPKLDVEVEIEGPNTPEALHILMTGKRLVVPALDCEYLFKILDADHDEDVKAGKTSHEDDWDNFLFFYMVLDRNNEVGVYEAYAQVVDSDDVEELLFADIPQALRDLYPDLMDADVSGETPYTKQVRHSGTGGFKGDV